MKHNIDELTLQAAIDEACEKTILPGPSQCLDMRPKYNAWALETPARLALAKAFLDRLPDPTPPELTEIKDYLWPDQTGLPNEHRDALIAIKRRDKLLTSRAEKAEAKLARIVAAADAVLREEMEASQPAVEAEADPYAELKAAYAAGKVIENLIAGKWGSALSPTWEYPVDTYRIKPEPSTFTAHGKEWTRHTPGDPMPCDGEASVVVLMRCEESSGIMSDKPHPAKEWEWCADGTDCEVIGWRYADKPTLEPAQSWQPKVGDVVTLKSGGPKMAVCLIQGTVCKCQWFKDDVADVECFEIATLQPA